MLRHLSPKLRAIAHRMNGHHTFFSDEDLYQEAAGRLWVAFGQGQLDDKTDSYILQGCYFHLKNYVRTALDKAKVVSMSAPIDSEGATIEDTLAGRPSVVHDDVDTNLLRGHVALKSLSSREREVIRLTMDGHTVRQIGERLGISHVMVVKIRSRIKTKCMPLKNAIDRMRGN